LKLPVNYDEIDSKQRRVVREEYTKLQKSKCYYCGARLDKLPPLNVKNIPIDKGLFPKGFFDNPIHLHHSHKTGMTIGAVHCYCNAVLWCHHDE